MDSSAGMRSKIEPSPTSSQGISRGMRVHGAWLESRSTSANSGGRSRLGELEAVQRLERVLVGHRRHAEARAAVADVAAVVDLVVAVEGRALRPRPLVGRHRADRAPPGALERAGEGEAVALDELVVAPLGADPDPRLQGGVRQPAEPAEGRRGEEGAARGEAAGPQLRRAPVEHRRGPRASSRPRPCRSSRRTRGGRPCRAGRSAAGRRAWCGTDREGSRAQGPRERAGRSGSPAPRRRRGRRCSWRRRARRRRAGRPTRRRARRRPGASRRGGRPRRA